MCQTSLANNSHFAVQHYDPLMRSKMHFFHDFRVDKSTQNMQLPYENKKFFSQ